jgi:hypothetical protein
MMSSRSLAGLFIVVAAIALILAHGSKSSTFTVDNTTLGLLALASIPYISTFVTSLKAGGVEVTFRQLSVYDQLLTFLDGIATKQQWTFLSPRSGETQLGQAFVVLTEELLKGARERFVNQIRGWLASDDVNQRWFAAEIVGYHQLVQLRRAVQHAPETKDVHSTWAAWEMNCVWAYSRLEEDRYAWLRSFLVTTNNATNQIWILQAFNQMIEAKMVQPEIFASAIAAFARQHRDDIRLLAQGLSHIIALLPSDLND